MESEDGVTPDGTAPLWDLKRDLVLLREELQEKNTTIRTLKSELKAVGGRSSIPRSKETLTRSASCNVATQTDRVTIKTVFYKQQNSFCNPSFIT